MPKINKFLDKIYRCPDEKIPKQKVDNSLIVWYDNLRVNPLLSYFSTDDIYKINEIASSITLSNNPKEKYRQIGSIMESRGFKFIGGGTNRRCYVCNYDSRIVAKVGTDKIGFSNNLREYVNQDVLKPFCCKIFEVTPCGTLAIIERVYPIKTIEEFQAVGNDIFNVLYFKIRNKDIAMEDIGFRSYKNWGIRDNFGAVLLDYPTMYVADPKKCYCTQRDMNGNYCNHTLDYDSGFDNIICTQCGHRYLSKSIAKKNGDNITELIYAAGNKFNNKKGECKMKISMIGRNGKVIEKDLNNGRTSYVKRQNNGYDDYSDQPLMPTSAKMDDVTYKKLFGHKKHDMKVSFTKFTPEELASMKKDNDTVKEEVKEEIPYDISPSTLFEQLNHLTNIFNTEISDILMDHLDEVYHVIYDDVPGVDTDKGMTTLSEYKSTFNIIVKSINKADEFYGQIIRYLHEIRKLSTVEDDISNYSPIIWEGGIPDMKFDTIFNYDMIKQYLSKVKAVLTLIPKMGFNSDIISGPDVLKSFLNKTYTPGKKIADDIEYLGMFIGEDGFPWYHPCERSEDNVCTVDVQDNTISIREPAFDYSDVEVSPDPEKASRQQYYNKKNRRGNKVRNKHESSDYSDIEGKF